MAKGKNSGTRGLYGPLPLAVRSRIPLKTALSQIDDHRTFTFEPALRPARLFSSGVASVGLDQEPRKKQGRSRVPYQLAFNAPAETLVCVRRSRRKQVLFAMKKTGKRGQRKPRRSKWSAYKC